MAKVVEFKPGELVVPARVCVPGCTLHGISENVGAKVVGVPGRCDHCIEEDVEGTSITPAVVPLSTRAYATGAREGGGG